VEVIVAPKLDLIGIVTANIGKSLAFYRALGWEIPEGQDDENHVEITLENGLRFAWDDLEMMRSFDPHITVQPHSVGAFLCDSPAEVDARHAQLVAAGYESHLAPWDAFWGQRYAVIRDPDGNTVDLFAPLAS
jgi:catechol 2,3-dioxygenase-like lactoylglutathione lyase family enzyme